MVFVISARIFRRTSIYKIKSWLPESCILSSLLKQNLKFKECSKRSFLLFMYKTGAAVFVQQQPPYAPYGPPSGNMFQPSYPPQQHMVGGSSHQGQQQQQYNASAPPPQAYHPQPERDYNDIHKEPRSMYPRPDYE
jgi:hypothetical protein